MMKAPTRNPMSMSTSNPLPGAGSQKQIKASIKADPGLVFLGNNGLPSANRPSKPSEGREALNIVNEGAYSDPVDFAYRSAGDER